MIHGQMPSWPSDMGERLKHGYIFLASGSLWEMLFWEVPYLGAIAVIPGIISGCEV